MQCIVFVFFFQQDNGLYLLPSGINVAVFVLLAILQGIVSDPLCFKNKANRMHICAYFYYNYSSIGIQYGSTPSVLWTSCISFSCWQYISFWQYLYPYLTESETKVLPLFFLLVCFLCKI